MLNLNLRYTFCKLVPIFIGKEVSPSLVRAKVVSVKDYAEYAVDQLYLLTNDTAKNLLTYFYIIMKKEYVNLNLPTFKQQILGQQVVQLNWCRRRAPCYFYYVLALSAVLKVVFSPYFITFL